MALKLLSIVELGGYTSLQPLYERLGFSVQVARNMRNAMKQLKTFQPDVIVAEFNYQTDFRDRTSSLESLVATVQWQSHAKVIALYHPEVKKNLDQFLETNPLFSYLAFPINENAMIKVLEDAKVELTI